MSTPPSATSSLRMLPALMSEAEKQRAATTAPADSTATPAASTAGQPTGDFYKQLLTVLALSMTMGGGGGDTSGFSSMSSGMQSGGMGNFMAPVLLTLIEKLLSNQVEQAAPQAASIQAGSKAAPSAAAENSGPEAFGDDVPAGKPVNGVLTQGSHPGHVAIDWGVPVGSDVRSTMNGKVVYAGWNNEGYGNLVIVENGPYRTYYGHLSKVPVKVGDSVRAGDIIAKSGNTGNSTGPHIHYEVRYHQQQVNPAKFL